MLNWKSEDTKPPTHKWAPPTSLFPIVLTVSFKPPFRLITLTRSHRSFSPMSPTSTVIFAIFSFTALISFAASSFSFLRASSRNLDPFLPATFFSATFVAFRSFSFSTCLMSLSLSFEALAQSSRHWFTPISQTTTMNDAWHGGNTVRW